MLQSQRMGSLLRRPLNYSRNQHGRSPADGLAPLFPAGQAVTADRQGTPFLSVSFLRIFCVRSLPPAHITSMERYGYRQPIAAELRGPRLGIGLSRAGHAAH